MVLVVVISPLLDILTVNFLNIGGRFEGKKSWFDATPNAV